MMGACGSSEIKQKKILVFSKTTGFRHIEAIDAGLEMFFRMSKEKGFAVDTTENAALFNEEHLEQYSAVVFLNVSGEVFNAEQRTAFQRYIQAGGGFLAIHGPTDAEREWPWYNGLIGAYFNSHPSNPNVQTGKFYAADAFASIDSLPQSFELTDEFYNFQQVDSSIRVLINIDEKTYKGGNMGERHPMVWYHDYDGGRSFYIAMGHTVEDYSNPDFLKIVWGGLKYATGGGQPLELNYDRSVPEANRFEKTVLIQKLDEPMQMGFAGDGSVFIAERRGNILKYDPVSDSTLAVGNIPAFSKYEDGLLGIALDPDFDKNSWLYVFFTEPLGKAFHVSRFGLDKKGLLDPGSEKNLLKIPKDVLDGSHTGGALMFDPRGNGDLFITVGDNSSPRSWPYSPIDERPGHEHWDAQRSAANSNDLRGKIVRIHPEKDGTYSVPAGNLFTPGTPKTRPEIYSMGHRQPWRISMDTKTGWLYEGEVGPDSRSDSAGLGPSGYDEFNIIKRAGNYGWPYFVGKNRAYWKRDFAAGVSLEQFDPNKVLNTSPNNTGITALPAAQPALIAYPYASSAELPLAGSGGRSAVGGPVFRKADFKKGNSFPAYYEGRWFVTDWIRG